MTCSVCGNVDTRDPCTICADAGRDPSTIVVVESSGICGRSSGLERSAARYHVLGGVLSPLDGVGPDDLAIERSSRA